MKTTVMLLVLFVFASCVDGRKYPSRDILKSLLYKNSELERVSKDDVNFLQDTFLQIKNNKNKFTDLQDSIIKMTPDAEGSFIRMDYHSLLLS